MRYLVHEIAAVFAVAMKENHGLALTFFDIIQLNVTHSITQTGPSTGSGTLITMKSKVPEPVEGPQLLKMNHILFPFFIRKFLNRIA